MEDKIFKKRCKFCNKKFKSLYPKQLEYNVQAHELSCKQKIMEKENKNLNKQEVKKLNPIVMDKIKFEDEVKEVEVEDLNSKKGKSK